MHKHEGTRIKKRERGGKRNPKEGVVVMMMVAARVSEKEGGCSFKGNVQPGVKLQPIVLHIVPEAHSKNSNKKRNHPLT